MTARDADNAATDLLARPAALASGMLMSCELHHCTCVVLSCAVPFHGALCCAVLSRVALCCAVLFHVALCCAVLCRAMLHRIALYCAVLCAALRCAVLCCAVLCCAGLCLYSKQQLARDEPCLVLLRRRTKCNVSCTHADGELQYVHTEVCLSLIQAICQIQPCQVLQCLNA